MAVLLTPVFFSKTVKLRCLLHVKETVNKFLAQKL